MVTAENIVKWYRARDAAGNYAAWVDDNPNEAAALDEALRLAIDAGMINGN